MLDLFKRAGGLFWAIVAVIKPLAPLLTRLVIGVSFIQTGIGKWENFHDIVDYFASLGFPAPAANAAFTATLEVVGGAALVVGIGTNLFAALLSCTMVVATLTAERTNLLGALTGSGDHSLSDILPLMFLMPLTWLVAFGGGPLSLDFLLKKKRVSGLQLMGSRKVLA
jgi:putative oxidoreductase